MPGIKFRWVDGAELEVLEPILSQMGAMSLNPKVSRALCAFDTNDSLVGFVCLQLIPHPEPLYVIPELRGTGLAQELAAQMVDYLKDSRGFVCVAGNAHSQKMCEELGMRRVEHPVYIA